MYELPNNNNVHLFNYQPLHMYKFIPWIYGGRKYLEEIKTVNYL